MSVKTFSVITVAAAVLLGSPLAAQTQPRLTADPSLAASDASLLQDEDKAKTDSRDLSPQMKPWNLVTGRIFGVKADVWNAAIALREVHSIADDKAVRNLEAREVRLNRNQPSLWFIEAGRNL